MLQWHLLGMIKNFKYISCSVQRVLNQKKTASLIERKR